MEVFSKGTIKMILWLYKILSGISHSYFNKSLSIRFYFKLKNHYEKLSYHNTEVWREKVFKYPTFFRLIYCYLILVSKQRENANVPCNIMFHFELHLKCCRQTISCIHRLWLSAANDYLVGPKKFLRYF